MEKTITVTLKEAREWYNNGNATLKKIALQAFSEKELNMFDFTKIKTFESAIRYLHADSFKEYAKLRDEAININCISKASAAMYKLNIVRKVLNTGYSMHLTKGTDDQKYIWHPNLRLITEDCAYYDSELKDGKFKKIGKIVSEGVTYNVLSGFTTYGAVGLSLFDSLSNVGLVDASFGFLGCATREIAEHLGRYFSMLIVEAIYGDFITIIKNK